MILDDEEYGSIVRLGAFMYTSTGWINYKGLMKTDGFDKEWVAECKSNVASLEYYLRRSRLGF